MSDEEQSVPDLAALAFQGGRSAAEPPGGAASAAAKVLEGSAVAAPFGSAPQAAWSSSQDVTHRSVRRRSADVDFAAGSHPAPPLRDVVSRRTPRRPALGRQDLGANSAACSRAAAPIGRPERADLRRFPGQGSASVRLTAAIAVVSVGDVRRRRSGPHRRARPATRDRAEVGATHRLLPAEAVRRTTPCAWPRPSPSSRSGCPGAGAASTSPRAPRRGAGGQMRRSAGTPPGPRSSVWWRSPAMWWRSKKTREYRGRYHVLQGAISPIDGIGPDKLRIRELLARLDDRGDQRGHPLHQPQHRRRRHRARTWRRCSRTSRSR